MKAKEKRILLSMPESLHREFKARCAEKGMSMREAFLHLMQWWTRK